MGPVLLLFLAILSEVVATMSLRATEGFTRPMPSLAVIAGYAVAFVCLSHCLKAIPIGIAYATWAGAGTVCIALSAWYVYEEALNPVSVCGMALIIVGVVLVNTYSSVH
jgi:small multidrug resistance pump